ncbi:MAG: TonB-dependent receptor plug domain-containing protein [Saprospiraceae bacterium]|nr:TonB-dependent receptor plug domain-containing protein [Saprospiraceae bacterium]
MSFGQYKIIGHVIDSDQKPFVGLEVNLTQLQLSSRTDEKGYFYFENIPDGKYALAIDYQYDIEYRTLVVDGSNVSEDYILERRVQFDEVQISAINWGAERSANRVVLDSESLIQRDADKEFIYTMDHLSSVLLSSDAGNGIGYSQIRIRGIDPSHLQLNINGIPITDAESSLNYYVDFSDIISSTEQIQIFKGNAPLRSGPGAFGPAIQLNINKLHLKPFLALKAGIGSYNSQKLSLVANSGLLENKYELEGRVSLQNSDGFIQRSDSRLRSFYLSVARIHPVYSWRINLLHGKETTGQAWFGVPESFLKDKKKITFNFAGTEAPGDPYHDIDQYKQSHLQFFFNRKVRKKGQFNFTYNITYGRGFYENYKQGQNLSDYKIYHKDSAIADLIRQKWLENIFGFTQLEYRNSFTKNIDYSLGLTGSIYYGKHFGIVPTVFVSEPEYLKDEYYNNSGLKHEVSSFFKMQKFSKDKNWIFGAELLFKTVSYSTRGSHDDYGNIDLLYNTSYLNPLGFIHFNIGKHMTLSGSMGYYQKEPFRDDLLNNPGVRNEELLDIELGVVGERSTIKWSVNFFGMNYFDLLGYSGKLNQVGEPIRINLQNALRSGVECDLTYKPRWGESYFSFQKSIHRIQEYLFSYPVYDDDFNVIRNQEIEVKNAPLAYSPETMMFFSQSLKWKGIKSWKTDFSIGYEHKFVGQQYLDNSGRNSVQIPSFNYGNFFILVDGSKWFKNPLSLKFVLNNVWDQRYFSNGWTYTYGTVNPIEDNDPYIIQKDADFLHIAKAIYPQALRHWNLALHWLIQ